MSEYRVEYDKNGVRWNVKDRKDGIEVQLEKENPLLEKIEVPSQLADKPVIALSEKSFYNNMSVKEIRLSDTIMEIGEAAFLNCPCLEKVSIPQNINKLPKWCFAYCKKLKEVEGLDQIIIFESYSFYKAFAAAELVLEQEIEFIGHYAFSECLIEKLYIGHIIHAGKMGFARCHNLQEVYFSNFAKAVPAYFFFACENLEKVSLNFVTAIGEYAFGKCRHLKNLKFPASLEKIGINSLFENQMESVIIPEKYNMVFYGEKAAKFIIRPTLTITLKYNEKEWKDEKKEIYYGEKIDALPLLETECKEIIGWYENPIQEQLSDEFLEFLVLKFGTWVKKLYETTLQPYNFEKPIYSDLLLYAKWRIKEDESEKWFETKKLCD